MNIKIKHEPNNITILMHDNLQIRIDKCPNDYNFKGKRESQANYIFNKMVREGSICDYFDCPKNFLRYY